MKTGATFILLSSSLLLATPTLQELEEQNKILEMQIENEKLKQRLQNLKNDSTPPPPFKNQKLLKTLNKQAYFLALDQE